jgi:FixJ family two-component response regulator
MAHPARQVVTIHDEREAVRHARGHISVIDDDEAVRSAVGAILRHEGYAVAEFASAADFLAFEDDAEPMFPGPRCLLLDMKMPGASGLEVQQRLIDRSLKLPILFMSGGSSAAEAVQAMKGGALDFLIKPFDDGQLLISVARALAKCMADEQASISSQDIERRFASLSARESQIARLVSQGLLNQQIAAELGIAERTVKLHRMHMMRKLGATNVIELIRLLDAVC